MIDQLFYFFTFKSHNPETSMSSVVNGFVHAVRKRSLKVPCAEVRHQILGLLGQIPTNHL